ncbi:MAG: L-glutamate gamma-semialdehyde dehydrogenase [Gemmatimonadetes bacterium]|nr:L-glutamate gamma-semialdehyde dehydrogenase [Gemmatimonadota bacterium]NNF13553.1 L-glutamate gamma-semialdehyde dehydrogenase [Gemmatimonadota bacterium]NNL30067.1 L-glutamate gamma-semialdehyde dehydrogenase [Gemmatimonadota bacterium]
MTGIYSTPNPVNERVLSYAPGTPERAALKAELESQAETVVDIPLMIGGEEVRTGDTVPVVMPHDHGHVLGHFHQAGAEEVQRAIDAANEAHREWSRMPWQARAAVFLRAADLIAGPWRAKLNAATMLGQSKTAYQAEIDAACETIDFFRFGAHFAEQIYSMQPISDPGIWNRAQYRALEGFVYAVSPFNFTAIGANLPGSPALMGNTSVWKPSPSAMLSNHYLMKIFEEAGLPPGVINFVAGDPVAITEKVFSQPTFAGVHFTGSTTVFRGFWKQIGANIETYRSYPRIVGETGGKDFVIAHPTADVAALKTALVRGAFEYQGQKCSAASRAYVPKSLWAQLEQPLVDETESLTMGDPRDFSNFVSAVIHERAFEKIRSYIEGAEASDDAEVIAGGRCDDSKGWFVRPTLIRAHDPRYVSMCEEIFGPVLTIHVYDDEKWEEALELVDTTSDYGLTGAVWARDRDAIAHATEVLEHAAGNFYVNDKPTGAVVAQQPFGGSRASGTNDKAGSMFNLLRWVSARSMKENFVPPTDYRYPFMEEA